MHACMHANPLSPSYTASCCMINFHVKPTATLVGDDALRNAV